MSRPLLLLLIALPLACARREENEESREQVHRAPHAVVPGVETAAATVETVRDSLAAFGAVAATGEPPELRDARTQLAEAEARQQLAAQQVRRLEALARGAVAPRKELDAARAEEASAAAATARARQVLASFGTSAERQPLSADETWVIAQVFQPDIARVATGAGARFVPDAFPSQTFAGTVDGAPAYVDPSTYTAPVRLRIHDPAHVLRPGMTGKVTIEFGPPRQAIVVPATAVVYDGEQAVVFVADGEQHYVSRPVQVGSPWNRRVEVTGLDASARVVVTGAASLLSAARLPSGGEEE
jgi:cobalt-zinc-cadmium efflux system membrane fusion protein